MVVKSSKSKKLQSQPSALNEQKREREQTTHGDKCYGKHDLLRQLDEACKSVSVMCAVRIILVALVDTDNDHFSLKHQNIF